MSTVLKLMSKEEQEKVRELLAKNGFFRQIGELGLNEEDFEYQLNETMDAVKVIPRTEQVRSILEKNGFNVL